MGSFFLVILTLHLIQPTTAFLPLRSEAFHKTTKHTRGCTFGDQHHTVGSSWHPNLGFPFGVMYCIRCDCIKYQVAGDSKKELTKVTCHDIRKDCPPVNCKDAKVQRGECCKTCPEDSSPEHREPSTSKWDHISAESKYLFEKTLNDDEARIETSSTVKQYVALITNEDNKQATYLARATLTLQRGNLHFSVHHSNSSEPHLVQLIDDAGTVLYTHETKAFHKGNAVICGVWRNLPKNILRELEEGTLSLRLTLKSAHLSYDTKASRKATIAKEYASGRIVKHRALRAETFSSLLYPQQGGGSGALVMLTLGRNFKNINFAILFRNLVLKENKRKKTDQSMQISVELRNDNGDVLRRTETRIAQSQEELADVWNSNSDLLRALGSGALHLVIEAQLGRRGIKHRYVGNITAKVTCDLLQAVLSGNNCIPAKSTGAVGSAVFHINADNSVSFEVSLSGLSSPVTSLMLNAAYKKRMRVIADITPQYRDSTAVGLLKEISAKELHLLLNNNVWVSVKTEQEKDCELTGNVAFLLYSGHLARYSGMPIPLSGSLVVPPVNTGAGGHAWVHLDDNCHLHYEIIVSGLNKDSDPSVTAHLHGLAEIAGVQATHKKLLKGFYGTEARGVLKEIPAELYDIMNNGSAFLQVATKRNPSGEIRGRIFIPNDCLETSEGEERDDLDAYPVKLDHDKVVHDAASPQRVVSNQDLAEAQANSCHFEGGWHLHNSEWSPLYDEKCTSCICEHGNVLCNPVVCPSLSCRHPVIVEGECCPVCQGGMTSFMEESSEKESQSIGSLFPMQSTGYKNEYYGKSEEKKVVNSAGCQQDGDPRLHPRGSSWNPFIQPFGYVTCVTCTCHHNDKVTCEKVQCEPAPCQNPIRKSPGDCCKVCPEPRRSEMGISALSERWMQDGANDAMCNFGKKLYPIGSSWTPDVRGLGHMTCLTCTCHEDPVKGVSRKCETKCTKIPNDCAEVVRTLRDCCPKCVRRKEEREREGYHL